MGWCPDCDTLRTIQIVGVREGRMMEYGPIAHDRLMCSTCRMPVVLVGEETYQCPKCMQLDTTTREQCSGTLKPIR